jgi:hypothetical protein
MPGGYDRWFRGGGFIGAMPASVTVRCVASSVIDTARTKGNAAALNPCTVYKPRRIFEHRRPNVYEPIEERRGKHPTLTA